MLVSWQQPLAERLPTMLTRPCRCTPADLRFRLPPLPLFFQHLQGCWQLQAEVVVSESFNIVWHQLHTGFEVQGQGPGNNKVSTECPADAPLAHAGGARRLVELTGTHGRPGAVAAWHLQTCSLQPCSPLSGSALLLISKHYSRVHTLGRQAVSTQPTALTATSSLSACRRARWRRGQRGTIVRYCNLDISETHVSREGGG